MPAQSACKGMWHMTHAEKCTATCPQRPHKPARCIQSCCKTAAMYRATCPQTETATCPYRARAQACYIHICHRHCCNNSNLPAQSSCACMLHRKPEKTVYRAMSSKHNCNMPIQSARTGMLQTELLHTWPQNPNCYMTTPAHPHAYCKPRHHTAKHVANIYPNMAAQRACADKYMLRT